MEWDDWLHLINVLLIIDEAHEHLGFFIKPLASAMSGLMAIDLLKALSFAAVRP
jgi:hypothetical protein